MAKKLDLGPILITDKDGNEINLNDHPLLHRAITHIGNLWTRCEKTFLDALDGSDRKAIQVSFAVLLNLKERAPVVDTTISFKDKCKEKGMSVVKTFRLSETDELEDPEAPPLPGVDMEAARKGKLADGKEPAPAEGGEKPKGKRGRKKKGEAAGDAGEQTATA